MYRTNLPVALTEFLGREAEGAQVVALLTQGDVRVLTLTGPGGIGKTRLAMQSAAETSESFPDGVWWVPLAPVQDARQLLLSVAQTLGVKEQPGRAPSDTLAAELSGKRTLLLLDNLEHLLPEAVATIRVLRDLEGPVLLVTSRERLRIEGKRSYPVPPLTERDGPELFAARARALNPEFSATPAVRTLCVDQLPLAIELASARTELFSADQLLERVSHRLDLLKGGRDADPRQQPLRATIDWSYDLLTKSEKTLFARMSVFSGGGTLEAAEEVANAEVDTLESSRQESASPTHRRGRPAPLWMLETIREYAAERLVESSEGASVFQRHAEYILALTKSAHLDFEAEGDQRHELVMRERANIHVALGWSLRSDPELGLRLAVALEDYWFTNEPVSGMAWLQQLLDAARGVPPKLIARALCAYGGSAHMAGDHERAEFLYSESLGRFRALGDEAGAALPLCRMGFIATKRGDLPRARALLEESLGQFRRSGSRKGEMQALGYLGEVAYQEGDLKIGLELLQRSAAMAKKLGAPSWRGAMLGYLVGHALDLRRLRAADSWARERLELSRRTGNLDDLVDAIADLAQIASREGDVNRAARLWGILEGIEAQRPLGAWPSHPEQHATRPLGASSPELSRARMEGRQMSFDDGVEYALGSRV